MQQDLKEFSIEALTPGMYIAQVAEQSGSVKIKTQGLVSSEKAIKNLGAKGVTKVLVDLSKSKLATDKDAKLSQAKGQDQAQQAEPTAHVQVPFEKEINKASSLYQEAKEIQSRAFDSVKSGAPVDTKSIEQSAEGLIDSVFRNQDALACMTRMRVKDEYLMEHSINVAIIVAIFAKHLNMELSVIQQLTTGAMLMDLGMIAVPGEILTKKAPLSDAEREQIQQHVNQGYQVLKKAKGLSDISLELVQDHHENVDGSGYPNGKVSDDLSTYSKIAKIVDCYHAMIAERPYRKAKSPISAFKVLRSQSDLEFDAHLVNEFINCMGIHPVGTLVKMKSNKLGIVIKSNPVNPIAPSVNVFYSVTNKCYTEPKIVDLAAPGCAEEIEKSVKPEEFKLDMLKFFKQILLD